MKKKIILLVFFITILTGCNKLNQQKERNEITPYPTYEAYELKDGNATEFSVSGVFSDDMVLQREQEIAIYGTAPESQNGKVVAVAFKDLKGSGIISNGKWKVIMQGTLKASDEKGHSLIVNGAAGTEITFENVLVGDIWYVGGQSNADINFIGTPMGYYSEDIKNISKDANIRIFYQNGYDLDGSIVLTPQDNPLSKYKWRTASKSVVVSSSMLGYFFAKSLTDINPDIPIGLVIVSCGGATLGNLAPLEVVEKLPDSMKNSILDYGAYKVGDCGIYNAFIHPFIDFGITGMIFYQGESDSLNSKYYADALKEYVQELRDRFRQHFYLLNVQLSSYTASNGIWDRINDMRNTQSSIKINKTIYNYEIITSMDVGCEPGALDGAHPIYKKPLGQRLGNIASSLIYGIGDMNDIACPIPKKVEFDTNKVTVEFEYTGGGLKIKEGDKVNGFEVLINNEWEKCDAEIIENRVIIHKQRVKGIRYGYDLRIFSDAQANLVSGTGLPAVAFDVIK